MTVSWRFDNIRVIPFVREQESHFFSVQILRYVKMGEKKLMEYGISLYTLVLNDI